MSLLRSTGVIAFFTIVSRIFGFARDMLLARILGAGLAADAFQLAFIFPNTFRRLFAEGAFSVAFVPMYSRKLNGPGEKEAAKFTNDVLSVFVWVLLIFSAIIMMAMPGVVWLLASDFADVAGKFDLAVMLSRITFPYLAFISLVAMLSGLLNSRSRFAPGAIAPILLNIVLIAGILIGDSLRSDPADDRIVALCLSISVFVAGVAQLVYLWWCVHREGLKLKIQRPRLTPDVKRLGMIILPATFGAGIYQISQFVDTFFATQLPQGSLTLLKYADRLNQMPLGIVGIALGTAILPMLSRHIETEDHGEAQRLQSQAFSLATLLTLPSAIALAICAPAFVTAFFVGGKFTPADGAIMSDIVVALVAGLPAYVLVKILNPGFFARSDTKTPVWTALVALIFNVGLNIYIVMIAGYGIVGLAAATAASATLNCMLLYAMLHRRGWFRFDRALGNQVARQIISCLVMAAPLIWLMAELAPWFGAAWYHRIWSIGVLTAAGAAAYFIAAFATGALDKERLQYLLRRRKAPPAS